MGKKNNDKNNKSGPAFSNDQLGENKAEATMENHGQKDSTAKKKKK